MPMPKFKSSRLEEYLVRSEEVIYENTSEEPYKKEESYRFYEYRLPMNTGVQVIVQYFGSILLDIFLYDDEGNITHNRGFYSMWSPEETRKYIYDLLPEASRKKKVWAEKQRLKLDSSRSDEYLFSLFNEKESKYWNLVKEKYSGALPL